MSRTNALKGALKRQGYARMAPHKFDLLDPGEWFKLCGQLVKRHVKEVVKLRFVCADLQIGLDLALYILRLALAWRATRIGKHYVIAAGGLIPPLPVSDDVWLDAIEVGRAIFRIAKRDAAMARHVLSVYAMAANLDRQIVLTVGDKAHLHFAKLLIAFVDDLKIESLQIGLVAYKNEKGLQADLHDLCGQLGLDPERTPMRAENARNLKAESQTRQAGLEVLRVARASAVTDQAFFSAMILGAAVQVWRFAVPATATAATGPASQFVTNRTMPIDPTSKLPPATARPGDDQNKLPESVQRGSPG